MRQISVKTICDKIEQMCIEANYVLPKDVSCAIAKAHTSEPFLPAKQTLEKLSQNADVAQKDQLPLCQDTGMVCVFLEVGQQVSLVEGDLFQAVQEGVRRGYENGFLRKSVVADPLRRTNTKDNTPAILHTTIIPGDTLTIMVAPKGFGSENMSRLVMLTPSAGREGVVDFVVDTVKKAGPNPCPPIIVGVGIGGNFDKVASLAKHALLRDLDKPNPDPYYAQMEQELLEKINALGIGPQGFGGKTTALGVNIEVYPTHIAGLPVAVNINCHVARHVTVVL